MGVSFPKIEEVILPRLMKYGVLLFVQVAAPRPICGSDRNAITTTTTGARLTLCTPSAPNGSCAGAAWHARSAGSQIRGDQAAFISDAVGSWYEWAKFSEVIRIQHARHHLSMQSMLQAWLKQ